MSHFGLSNTSARPVAQRTSVISMVKPDLNLACEAVATMEHKHGTILSVVADRPLFPVSSCLLGISAVDL